MSATASGHVTAPRGFRAAGIASGIKEGAKDLALLLCDAPAAAAGTFTTNAFAAAPVVVSRERLRAGAARAVIVNSGCANAATGAAGIRDAEAVAAAAAARLGIDPAAVLPASTGRIGRRLPVDRIERAIPGLVAALRVGGGADAAEAILTTDTRPKEAIARARIGGAAVTVAGMAKGAGMIQPRMATMLAFITTDAAVAAGLLRALLRRSVERSFNRITVDGDTSTNDSVYLLASGLAGSPPIEREGSAGAAALGEALDEVTASLAEQIVRDGEGASKLVEIVVRGARDGGEAERIGRSVANSPLFKTAVYGGDANWGRIVSAIGASGAAVSPAAVAISLQGEPVFSRGAPCPADEGRLAELMRRGTIRVEIDAGAGDAASRILTCDLTPAYVELNKK
ncbi:MAG: bifunctional glutamate N-acetyltransferase/amino-acid acetyltransferase ArgJ [bacterium]|nr:bifunctional glutamate N-acetyltransferase/amino-acid acetyltransferase ArgJ [bacterium]